MSRLNFEKELKVIEMSEKGFSLQKIAENTNLDSVTVYKVKKELNL